MSGLRAQFHRAPGWSAPTLVLPQVRAPVGEGFCDGGSPVNVTEIRAKFPNPVSAAAGSRESEYGVDGAFCHVSSQGKIPLGFPPLRVLAAQLFWENPQLGKTGALLAAHTIIERNDQGNVQGAWAILDIALKYGKDAQP